MSESEIQKKVLETLWEAGKPMKSREIAKKTGLSVPSSTTHVLNLVKAGYVSTPKRGYYVITEYGKEVIGLPKVDRKQASAILSPVSLEKAFHFHTGVDQYVGVYATSLNDFCEKIQKIDLKSIEFHMPRKDFEYWLRGLGDLELAKRMDSISRMNLSGDDLRKRVYETVRDRCEELASLSRGARQAYLVFRKTH